MLKIMLLSKISISLPLGQYLSACWPQLYSLALLIIIVTQSCTFFNVLILTFCGPRIGDIIDEDVVHSRAPFVACTQQCFAIKAGIDGLLDVARRSFCDTSEGGTSYVHPFSNLYCSHS